MSSPSQPVKTLRELRQTRGWRQVDVAALLGVHADMVSRWERGERVPRARTQHRLAILFGVPVDQIVFRQDGERS